MKNILLTTVLSLGLIVGVAHADYHSTKPATVVDIAVGAEDFSVLVSAVVTAGLVDALSGEGPFTVFAPTNDAFVAALEALGITAEQLLASPDLASILTYHVVAGKLLSGDVIAAVQAGGGKVEVETLQGSTITVEIVDGSVVLNGTARVITVDLEAGNGVIHVIDAVILPPSGN
jgi:transforming growth factor-beta-induced protein